MSKKKNHDAIKHNVELIGITLMHMVAAPGIKKDKGISRAESVALSYGLSMGIGLGYILATDAKCRKDVTGVDDKYITIRDAYRIATRIMSRNIDDLPEHRDRLLAVKEDHVIKVMVEQDGEVR